MRESIALFLVISLLIINCSTISYNHSREKKRLSLAPCQKPGQKLVIQKKDGLEIKGELIVVNEDSLLLKQSESGADVTVDVGDIGIIKIKKKKGFLKGAGYGFLGGAAFGAILGLAEGDDPPGWFSMTAGEKAAAAGIFFGIIGLLIGGISGSISRTETIYFDGKSDTEIKKELEELRKKARVPKFQ